MLSDKFLGPKPLAFLLALVGAFGLLLGLMDMRTYAIPGAWSALTGLSKFVLVYLLWKLKAGGWRVAIAVVAIEVLGWALLSYGLLQPVASSAGLSGDQIGVLQAALNGRLQLAAVIGLLVATCVYPARDQFVN